MIPSASGRKPRRRKEHPGGHRSLGRKARGFAGRQRHLKALPPPALLQSGSFFQTGLGVSFSKASDLGVFKLKCSCHALLHCLGVPLRDATCPGATRVTTATCHRPALLGHQRLGAPGGSAVAHLPSAQGVVLGSQDQVPRRAPCTEPASPSACVSASLSLSLSLMNK